MNKKLHLLSLAMSCLFFSLNAQQEKHYVCGTGSDIEQILKDHPELVKDVNHHHAMHQIQEKDDSYDSTTVYIIPVVFHVIHQYGAEHISEKQILNAVDILNRDYRLKNNDTSEIITEFKKLKADVKIEFRLATKDPWGNCTNGIEYIYSHETINGDAYSKLNQWDRSKYFNIWVVKDMENPSIGIKLAYATIPESVDLTNFFLDGVVVRYNCLGEIEAGEGKYSRTLTHEVGHWLNLYHTWGKTNSPEVACGDDDVVDTPVTKGHFSSTNLRDDYCKPGTVENLQNYMEYASVERMFTKGQVKRMRMAITSETASRSNLITVSNHGNTGIDVTSAPVCEPIASFYSNTQFICQGDQVKYFDRSWQATVTNREWTFEGGNPAVSTADNVVVTYDTPGYKKVVLKVSNANGTDVITKENYIYVSPNYADHYGPFNQDFELDNSFFFVQNPENNFAKFTRVSGVGYDNSTCYKLNNYKNIKGALQFTDDWFYYDRLGGSKDLLYTCSYDLSHTTEVKVSFKYAYSNNGTSATQMKEKLNIYVSKDCGATWILRKTLKYAELLTAGNNASEDFIPSSNEQWKSYSFDYTPSASERQTRFKFEFEASDVSNNFYFDNFNVSGVLGLFDVALQKLDLNVFPNPSKDGRDITVAYEAGDSAVQFILRDLQGKIVHEEIIEETNTSVQRSLKITDRLNASCYFLEVRMGNESMVKKLVVL